MKRFTFMGLLVLGGALLCPLKVHAADLTEQKNITGVELSTIAFSTKTITVEVEDGDDIALVVNEALKEARDHASVQTPYIIKIPAGNYVLSDKLRIYSNTTLDATGCVISDIQGNVHNMVVMGYAGTNSLSTNSGYQGYFNITLKGGTYLTHYENKSSLVRMSHATNVTFTGVTFTGGGCAHQVEVCAINGFYVKGCTFENLVHNPDLTTKQEALQLDIPCSENVFPDTYQDGTVMQNVEITNCVFRNVPRGVGTHTMLLGAYHQNITISNNTFEHVDEEAIVALNYYNCKIENNIITNCGGGILFQYFKPNSSSIYITAEDVTFSGKVIHDAEAIINGNRISTTYSSYCGEIQGIKIYGKELTIGEESGEKSIVPPGDYYVEGVSVTNNTIQTAGYGIHLVDARNCIVSGNTITQGNVSSADPNQSSYNGIYLANSSKGNQIVTNTIIQMSNDGIDLFQNCSDNLIQTNTIQSSTRDGICVGYNSNNNRMISNTIEKAGRNGMSLRNTSSNNLLQSNGISDVQYDGIYATTNCLGIKVLENTIKTAAHNGIGILEGSTLDTLSGNLIQNASCYGIRIYKSSVLTKITKNQILGAGLEGLYLSTDSVTVGITDNLIAGSKGSGICIYGKSKVKGSVSYNIIKDTSENKNAIYLLEGSSVDGNIDHNQILKESNGYSTGKGVFLYNKATVAGSIQSNTIVNTKDSGVVLSQESYVGSISENIITSPGQKGIYVYNQSGVATIAKNTIQNSGSQGLNIASQNSSILVTMNSISSSKDNAVLLQTGNVTKTITVSNNSISSTMNKYGIRVTSGKLNIYSNTMINTRWPVGIDYGVKGYVGTNTLKNNYYNKYIFYGTTNYTTANYTTAILDQVTSGGKSCKVYWKKIKDSSGYEIQYANNKTFTKGKTSVTISGNSTVNKTISALTTGTTYYVRVRAYKTVFGVRLYGGYSTIKSVLVK